MDAGLPKLQQQEDSDWNFKVKGGKPVPTHLKLIRGDPGKRALPKNEPEYPLSSDAPEWISDRAKPHWPLIARQLEDAGVLTTIDATALAMYCEAFETWRDANEKLMKFGSVIKGREGIPTQSPYFRVANAAFMQMMRLLTEFGMTPSSRSKVAATKRPEKQNPFTVL